MEQTRNIRQNKAETVASLSAKFASAKSIFLTDYSGLTVEAMNNLRRSFRKSNVEYWVGKNTLVRLAAEKTGYKSLVPYLEGPTALAFAMKEATAPAKVILDFLRNNQKPTIKAIIFEGQFFEAKQAEAISKLPTREEVLAQLMGTLNAPLYGLVNSLQGILRNFLYALHAVADKKEKAAGAAQ
ncbi:MAG: 50S ribosomal protein L10 [candidate division KSB1 bacterium]|nr:50S ribosomal protein L10 [candidate division KSB1 bacterium]MDZ7301386.1 50S ribosomal protein L10 [candidate division KSB1 bacterium]MDZ7310729.1 50S ribosomal protein L10 [candidate division KSB1 bacterium]